MKRDLTSLNDLSKNEIEEILDIVEKSKASKKCCNDLLSEKHVGLVFQKPSNRTRVSFEVGIQQLGGHCIYLGPEEINLGVRESTSDVSKTLSRYLDGIVARVHNHEDILELSKSATVPIVNGLCDKYHPCQALTDLFSIKEKFGSLKGLTLAYVGDGNNVCNSLLIGCAKVGMNMHVATPEGYEVSDEIKLLVDKYAKESNSRIIYTNDPVEAVKDVEVIYADVWISMGQEEESHQRINDFHDYQINSKLAAHAKDNYIFMHCLPAHRGQEATEDIIDGEHSIIFDQAENRLHTQKAILIFLFNALKD